LKKKNYLVITYEKEFDGSWGVYNSWYVGTTINDIISSYYKKRDVLILNIIYYGDFNA
jgi:hypothetical protein